MHPLLDCGLSPQIHSGLKVPHQKKKKNITKPNELIWYYLQDSPKCGFVGEEILVVPVYTKLLPISEYLPQLPLPRLLFLYVVYQWLCVNSVLQNPKLSPSLSCS